MQNAEQTLTEIASHILSRHPQLGAHALNALAAGDADAATLLSNFADLKTWVQRQFDAPSPPFVKRARLLQLGVPKATWVETGTYLGQTTALLASIAPKVYSVEPEPTLFFNARAALQHLPNVQLFHGTSEQVFPALLPQIAGDVNFWLDGHYSGGTTFQGPHDTPIMQELDAIRDNIGHYQSVCVLIDDVRCFDPRQTAYSTYPRVDTLVDWARQMRFHWSIEHDIFIARSDAAARASAGPN